MSNQQDVGRRGEDMAAAHLEHIGLRVIERNWRWSRAEIDIIAMDGEVLVFVEVKTRSYDFYGQPEDAVDRKKELMIADAGAAYMRQVDHQWEIRFDIISVILPKKGNPTIHHFPDAFFPGL